MSKVRILPIYIGYSTALVNREICVLVLHLHKLAKLKYLSSSTSGENIGDSGLVQAYRAWHGQFHSEEEKRLEPLLPGLNYTQ